MPVDELEQVARETAACPACQSVLDALDALEDSVIHDLRTGSPSDSALADPEFDEQVRLARRIAQVTWAREDDETESLLAPEAECRPTVPRRLGQYELVERVGRGGMGEVWKGFHTRLKRDVAIKLLPRERTAVPQAVARFGREMEAVARLDHPNLVRAYDGGEADAQHYLVMEYVDGIDLSHLVRRYGPLPIPIACELVRQTAIGLQYIHEHGLVHRDIKPSNLMLTAEGQVKILDLGLALLNVEPIGGEEISSCNRAWAPPTIWLPSRRPTATVSTSAPTSTRDVVEKELVYIVEKTDGKVELLRPLEFNKRYGINTSSG